MSILALLSNYGRGNCLINVGTEGILGCRISAALGEKVQALKLTPSFRHLEVSKIVLDKTHYTLNSEPP